jgi:hypothetical protein
MGGGWGRHPGDGVQAFMAARGWGRSWSIPEQPSAARGTIKVPTPHHSTPTEGMA